MAVGMTMIGAGAIWATQVPVHGHFVGNLPGRYGLAGAGTAFAFIPISIAALAGVKEHQAGLASGLLNSSQQLGGAIGIAIASSVAASHTQTLLHAGSTRPRGAHRRVSASALGARRDRPAGHPGDLRARPSQRALRRGDQDDRRRAAACPGRLELTHVAPTDRHRETPTDAQRQPPNTEPGVNNEPHDGHLHRQART